MKMKPYPCLQVEPKLLDCLLVIVTVAVWCFLHDVVCPTHILAVVFNSIGKLNQSLIEINQSRVKHEENKTFP